MDQTLKEKTFKNISYNALTKVIALFFQAFANIILSRSLTSSDYGITGFAFIFINFLTQFNDIGINSAVIQRRELDEKGLYTAFTIKAVLGITLFAFILIAAPLSLYFFDSPAVVNVLRLLALMFLINIFYFLPNSLLARDLNYKRISFANTCSVCINATLAIILALAGFKYWSIVIANLGAAVVLALSMNFLNPVRIKIYFDREIAKEFISYGWHIFVSGIIVFTIFNADNFIIGAVRGSSMLGYYAIAFNWASIVCTILSSVVLTVLFPTFSRIQVERDKIKSSYLKVLEYISLIGVLAYMTLFVIAKEFFVQILGHGTEKWLPALTALRILCFYGMFRALLEPVGSVIMAVGKTELLLRATLLAAILELVLLYPALKYFGIEGVSVVVTIAYISQYFIYIPCLKKELGIRPGDLIKSVIPAVFSLVVIIPFYFLCEYLQPSITMLLLVQKTLVYVLSYLLFYGIFTKWKLLKEVRNMLGGLHRV